MYVVPPIYHNWCMWNGAWPARQSVFPPGTSVSSHSSQANGQRTMRLDMARIRVHQEMEIKRYKSLNWIGLDIRQTTEWNQCIVCLYADCHWLQISVTLVISLSSRCTSNNRTVVSISSPLMYTKGAAALPVPMGYGSIVIAWASPWNSFPRVPENGGVHQHVKRLGLPSIVTARYTEVQSWQSPVPMQTAPMVKSFT